MNNKDKNRELLSRRDFFRKAAINTLPFIAAIAVPPIFTACSPEPTPTPSGCDGCSSTCEGSCDKSCSGSCEESCAGSSSNSGSSCSDCSSTCKDTCSNTCSESCKNACSDTCTGNSTGNNNIEFATVDLGLTVLWASFNLGTSSPHEYNDGYYWADATGKATSDEMKKLIKEKFPYQENKEYNISNSEYDIAKIQLGNGWRLPTKKEIEELTILCDGTFETKENIKGFCFKGSNGNSIFLPYKGNNDFYMSGEIEWQQDKSIHYKILAISSELNKAFSTNYQAKIEEQYPLSRLLVRPVKDGGSGCNDCASGCINACSTDCYSMCKDTCKHGCTEACKEGCESTCSGGCKEGCKEGCKNTCSGGCEEGCKEGCKNTCSGDCEEGCKDSCTGGCSTGCYTGCKNSAKNSGADPSGCGGCDNTCNTLCGGQCHFTCGGSCRGYCQGSCYGTCIGNNKNVTNCPGTCFGTCYTNCDNTCSRSCYTTCQFVGKQS